MSSPDFISVIEICNQARNKEQNKAYNYIHHQTIGPSQAKIIMTCSLKLIIHDRSRGVFKITGAEESALSFYFIRRLAYSNPVR